MIYSILHRYFGFFWEPKNVVTFVEVNRDWFPYNLKAVQIF